MPAAEAITRPVVLRRGGPRPHHDLLDTLAARRPALEPDEVLDAVGSMTEPQRRRLAAMLGVPAPHPLLYLPGPHGFTPPAPAAVPGGEDGDGAAG